MFRYFLKNRGDLLSHAGIFQDIFRIVKEKYRISFRRKDAFLSSVCFSKPSFEEIAFDSSFE